MPSSPDPKTEPYATNALERASLPFTRRLAQLPPAVPIVTVFLLVLVGAFLGPWGAIPLGLVTLFLLWMLGLSWPRLTSSEKLMRIAVIVLVLGLTIVKLFPR